MDGLMGLNWLVEEGVDERVNGWVGEWLNVRVCGWMIGWVGEWVNGLMNG